MSTKVFILVVAAIGILYMVLFARMKKRRDKRLRPGERNPIQDWLKGGDDEDEEK